MKVLIMDGSLNPASFIKNLISGLLQYGIDVALIGKRAANAFDPGQNKGKFIRLHYPIMNAAGQLLAFMGVMIRYPRTALQVFKMIAPGTPAKLFIKRCVLYAQIIRCKPDIIHIQWATHLTEFEDLITANRFKIIVSLRGRNINVMPLSNKRWAVLYERNFPKVDFFHAVSFAIGREAGKYGAPRERIKVIYSVINPAFLSSFRELNPSRTPLSVLSVGRFHWKKGYAYGLRAIGLLKAKGVEVHYTIVAGSDIPEEILFLVHTLGLESNVSFVEKVTHAEMPALMQSHSVLLLPSLEEGIANVVLEAMAVGLPVISTSAGGMDEAIVDGHTGWLVPLADPVAMEIALSAFQLLPDEELFNIRKNAHDRVMENNLADNQIPKFIQLYQDVKA